ncbi:hypothetical protein SJI45_21535 [Streptomyces sp. S399]|uniref:hypothetical protein n=1 Tax=Streptomyces sp. S399 TaxID=3096009 RepID=UPI002A7EDD23|nr:hypothetical protein [Streptomyces sp. S399]WPR53247.1 hypothetical protein SJI45_21535 [Streptomyces sp. S399]
MVAAQLLGTAGVYLATWPYSLGGGLTRGHGLLHAADAVLLAGLTATGFVVGRLVRWRGAPLLPALACYALFAIPAYAGTPMTRLVPTQQPWPGDEVPALWLAPVLAVWTGGLAMAALIGHTARRKPLALAPLGAAVLAGALLVQTGDDAWRTDPGPSGWSATRVSPGSASPRPTGTCSHPAARRWPGCGSGWPVHRGSRSGWSSSGRGIASGAGPGRRGCRCSPRSATAWCGAG